MERYILGPNNAVDRSVAANVFYVAVMVFGIAAAFLGPWLERNGPFKGAFMGATLFFLGNLLTALVSTSSAKMVVLSMVGKV